MRKFWLVFRYEYLRHVLRKRFLFALFSLPLVVLLLVGVIFISVYSEYDARPAGYVDLSGSFQQTKSLPPNPNAFFPAVQLDKFKDEQTARQALESGNIQAYFVIDAGYLKNGKVKMVARDVSKESVRDDFTDFLRYNLLAAQPEAVSQRLTNGPDITVQSLGSSRRVGENEFATILVPMISGLLFMLVINTSGSYLVQALVEEKENRTMEIIVTSVSPEQLMAGKVVGNLSVGLTELAAWIIFGVIALAFAEQYIPGAQSLNFGLDYIGLMIVTLIPAFIMVAALMAMAGSTTTDTTEAQQLAGLFTLPVILPFMLISTVMGAPNSPLAIAMSLFPLTAPIGLPLRAAFTEVPLWQSLISISLLVFCALGALWLAGRAFRIGMLRYGKRLSWREILGRTA